MKFKLLLLIIALGLNVISYGQNRSEPKAIVTGEIEKNWSNQIEINGVKTIIDKDGNFKLNVDVGKASFVNISYEYKKLKIYIEPRKKYVIKINGKSFPKNVVFKKNNFEKNNFLITLSSSINSSYQYLDDNKSLLFSLETKDYVSKIDSLKTSHYKELELFRKNNRTDTSFYNKVKSDIRFQFDRVKLVYPIRYYRFNSKNADLPKNYFNKIGEQAFNNSNNLEIESFLRFTQTYLNIQTVGEKYNNTNYLLYPLKLDGELKYNSILNLKATTEITNYYLTREIQKIIDCGINNLGVLMSRYNKDCTDITLKRETEELYNKSLDLRKQPPEIKIYKEINNQQLEAHIFYPKNYNPSKKYSTYIFFHGGSWNSGNPEWGYNLCEYYAEKGMLAISIEYRLLNLHGVRTADCITDAKDAIKWVRENEEKLGVDANKIVVDGFSAGGHLALSSAVFSKEKESKPNALILRAASYDLTRFSNMNKNEGANISPLLHLDNKLVPTIMFHGTQDYVVPFKEFSAFKTKMEKLNNNFEYHIFNGAGHFDLYNDENYKIMMRKIDNFLLENNFY